MKKYFILVLIALSILQFSCTSYTKEDLTVIDNLKLGQSPTAFHKSCDDAGIKNKVFLTKLILLKEDIPKENALKFYYTEKFNFSTYGGKYQDHLGLFYLTIIQGTNNIYKLDVLLVHTQSPFDFAFRLSESDRNDIVSESQDINLNYVNEVKNLLIQRYGIPKDTMHSGRIPIFILEGSQVNEYVQEEGSDGELYIWETKALRIKFYTGITHPSNYFSLDNNAYHTVFDKSTELPKGCIHCKHGAYISYEIKPDVIEKMKLNKLNI